MLICLYLKEPQYHMKTPRLEQPMRRTANYGLNTHSYLGAKDLFSDYNYTKQMAISELILFLKYIEGPISNPFYREKVNLYWPINVFLTKGIYIYVDFFFMSFYGFHFLCFNMISMYAMSLKCTFLLFSCIYSRIIYLNLSVVKIT